MDNLNETSFLSAAHSYTHVKTTKGWLFNFGVLGAGVSWQNDETYTINEQYYIHRYKWYFLCLYNTKVSYVYQIIK